MPQRSPRWAGNNGGSTQTFSLAAVLVMGGLAFGPASAAPPTEKPATLPSEAGVMKVYTTQYYIIHTDLGIDEAREAAIRMKCMVEEYHNRTRDFAGDLRTKLPFYLFANTEEYRAAGGPENSAGVFMGNKLMGTTFRSSDGSISLNTWHVVQHEGFHQFVDAVIGGDMPPWINEGMAEYFGEAVFTGDSFVTGLIPQERMIRVRDGIRNKDYRSVEQMMKLTQKDWNSKLTIANYDEAWSMVYFLAHGEDGKYQKALTTFMHLVGQGMSAQPAWNQAFGGSEGFEAAYEKYWLNLPMHPTADGYVKAIVLQLTSFLSRAQLQKKNYDSFDQFMTYDPTVPDPNETNWLPPTLFLKAQYQVKAAQEHGYEFELVKEKNKLPTIVCTIPDGRKVTGRFTLRDRGVGQVTAEMPKPASKASVTQSSVPQL